MAHMFKYLILVFFNYYLFDKQLPVSDRTFIKAIL